MSHSLSHAATPAQAAAVFLVVLLAACFAGSEPVPPLSADAHSPFERAGLHVVLPAQWTAEPLKQGLRLTPSGVDDTQVLLRFAEGAALSATGAEAYVAARLQRHADATSLDLHTLPATWIGDRPARQALYTHVGPDGTERAGYWLGIEQDAGLLNVYITAPSAAAVHWLLPQVRQMVRTLDRTTPLGGDYAHAH